MVDRWADLLCENQLSRASCVGVSAAYFMLNHACCLEMYCTLTGHARGMSHEIALLLIGILITLLIMKLLHICFDLFLLKITTNQLPSNLN